MASAMRPPRSTATAPYEQQARVEPPAEGVMMRFATSASLILAMMSFVACGGGGTSPADIQELQQDQKDILAKIGDLEKTVERVKSSAHPGGDPDKFYNIPLDRAPIRGPKDAKVTIVTFSDFQCPSSLMAN